jgi:hypothetical protein
MSWTLRTGPRFGAATACDAMITLAQNAMVETEFRTENP